MERVKPKEAPLWFRRACLKMTANLGHIEAYFVRPALKMTTSPIGSGRLEPDGEEPHYLARVMSGGRRMLISASNPGNFAILTSEGRVTLAGEAADDVGETLEALGKAADNGEMASGDGRAEARRDV